MSSGLVLQACKRARSHAAGKIPADVNPDLYAHCLAEHIRHTFSIVRIIRLEQDRPSKPGQSKIASYQKKATTAETIITNGLVAKLKLNVSDKVRVLSIEDQEPIAEHTVCSDDKSSPMKRMSSSTSAISSNVTDKEKEEDIAEDDAGIPTCFGKFLECTSPQGKNDRPQMPDVAPTSPEDNTHRTPPRTHKICVTSSITPLQPDTKKRKRATLAGDHNTTHANAETVDKKPAIAHKKPACAKAKTHSKKKTIKDADVKINSPSLCIGGGTNLRAELCAKNDKGERVYIFGTYESCYGSRLKTDCEAMKKYIEDTPNVTKADVLRFKDSLKN